MHSFPTTTGLRPTAPSFTPNVDFPPATGGNGSRAPVAQHSVYEVFQVPGLAYYPTPASVYTVDSLSSTTWFNISFATSPIYPPTQNTNHLDHPGSQNTIATKALQAPSDNNQSLSQQNELKAGHSSPLSPNFRQINRILGRCPTTASTDRIVADATTGRDPTRYIITLQHRPPSPVIPQLPEPTPKDCTGSQSSSQHLCQQEGCYKMFGTRSLLA